MPLHENAIRAFYSVFQRKPVRLDPVDTGSRQENVSERESAPKFGRQRICEWRNRPAWPW